MGFGVDTAYRGDGLTLFELKEALDASPFGGEEQLEWLAFDACLISRQLTDYALMENPLGLLDLLIQNEISLLAVEPQSNTNMFAFFISDGISMLLQDLQIPEMQEIAKATYQDEAVKVGERSYIRLIEDGTLIYFTVINGVRAGFQLVITGAEPTAEEEGILAAFVGMTVFRQS